MIYSDFKSVLVTENNEQQNSNESYTSMYQKHACSYGYKLVCVDYTFSEPFKSKSIIQNKNQNILFTWMQIIYMVIPCLNFLQMAGSDGLILKILT